MGNKKRVWLDSKGKVLLTTAKRKNRRLAQKRCLKKKKKLAEQVTEEIVSTVKNLNNGNKSRLSPVIVTESDNQVQKTEDKNGNMSRSSPVVLIESENQVPKTEDKKNNKESIDGMPSGRRIIDMAHLFSQIFGNKHKPFDCTIADMEVVSEKRNGFFSIFYLKCKLCGVINELSTEPKDTSVPINSAITLAAISSGIGYSQLAEICSAVDMPVMTDTTYNKYHQTISLAVKESAWESMEAAGKEEAEIARTEGRVDKNGIPEIAIVADGAWSMRSYGVNYNAKSGVGCIIGYRTGKLLDLGVRNKYCSVCDRALCKRIEPPQHKCFKNWNSTSTGMESDIIVECFKNSIKIHNLKYMQLIGDGDSSVSNKLKIQKPYGNDLVKKIECKNHLIRNFFTKFRDLYSRTRSSSKNVSVPANLRKQLSQNERRFRICIKKSIAHRIQENSTFEEKCTKLMSDLKNIPSHIFGEHEKCSELNYFKCSQKGVEKNVVPDMKDCGLYQDIESCMRRLICNCDSLIANMDNNLAEHYNSVVCKFVGGKRIHFSGKGSYETRCHAAALKFNTDEYYDKIFTKIASNRFSSKQKKRRVIQNNCLFYTKRYESKKRKQKINLQKWRKNNPSRTIKTHAPADEDYGSVSNVVVLSKEELELKKDEFLKELEKTPQEIVDIEKNTRGQANSNLWMKERAVRITASNFGRVCKLQPKTSCQNLVKSLLYSTFSGNAATRYGKDYERVAREDLEKHFGRKIEECGLYIDPEYYFLGASPDGLMGDHLIEIKCPASIKDMEIREAIESKKLKYALLVENEIKLKRNDAYYYQVQGQLAIAKKEACYFCIWTKKGFLIEEIQRDRCFWETEMLPKLRGFFFECLLPELADPQYPKKLPIRNPTRSYYKK